MGVGVGDGEVVRDGTNSGVDGDAKELDSSGSGTARLPERSLIVHQECYCPINTNLWQKYMCGRIKCGTECLW